MKNHTKVPIIARSSTVPRIAGRSIFRSGEDLEGEATAVEFGVGVGLVELLLEQFD